MKSAITTFFALVAVGTLVSGANGVMSKKPQSEERAIAPNESSGFEVIAVLEKKGFRVDEPVILKLSIRNVARRALLVSESNPATDYALDVTDVTGKAVPLTEFGRQIFSHAGEARVVLFTLQPGEKKQSVVQVNRLFAILSPGTYYVTAKRTVPRTPPDPREFISISSNRVSRDYEVLESSNNP